MKIPPSVIPDGSTAAVVNLTVDRAAAAGYLTAFPCGQPAPPSSNLNFVAGEARAVAAIVGLGLGSTMCVLTDVAADVIVDVTGYYAPAPQFRADRATAAPQRHAHRRHPQRHRRTARPVRGRRDPQVRSRWHSCRGGDEASSVMLNVIAANPRANGYLTIYPCSSTRPEVSSLNYTAPAEATNLADGRVGGRSLDLHLCVRRHRRHRRRVRRDGRPRRIARRAAVVQPARVPRLHPGRTGLRRGVQRRHDRAVDPARPAPAA